MIVKEVLERTAQFFRSKNFESPRLEAELLLAHGLKWSRVQIYMKYEQPLKESELEFLRELVRRRSQGVPMAYITGEKAFFGENFLVNESVLIPRPETESLAEKASDWIQKQNSENELTLLDLGCGSGCIGLSLLKKFPQLRVFSVDISPEAIQVATENARRLGVEERWKSITTSANQRDQILELILLETGKESIDLLVSNPPYIAKGDPDLSVEVARSEPALALFAEDEGYAFLKEWSSLFSPSLSKPGLLLMEMGWTQGPEMKKHLEDLQFFDSVGIERDLSGKDRMIRGERHG